MSTQTRRHLVLAGHRFRDDAWAVVLLWTGFLVFVLAMVMIVAALRGPIQISGWETASQLPRWFAGGIGVYLTAVYLPLYVAHGYTRREIARQTLLATCGTVLVLAMLMTLGYGIERLVYAAAGWPQTLNQSHLYASADAYPLVFLEFLLLFAVWIAAGGLVGAAIYRKPPLGLLFVPLGLILVGLAETVLSPGFFELLSAFFGFLGVDLEGVSIVAAIIVSVGCVAVALPLTWLLVRDMPLRNQRA
jgi:hypothetical protein